MFERPHHQRIARLLQAFDAQRLVEAQCFFAGGTAIALQLGEYRESVDVDFLCASLEGFRALRNAVTEQGLGDILRTNLPLARPVRSDQYGIRTVVEVDQTPIKVEFVSEGRIALSGGMVEGWPVPLLCRDDLYAEKLLANADRGQDRSVLSRDIIDLAMMIDRWGPIPEIAWEKARHAYGPHLDRAFESSLRLVGQRDYLKSCLDKMAMEADLIDRIPALLGLPAPAEEDRESDPAPRP